MPLKILKSPKIDVQGLRRLLGRDLKDRQRESERLLRLTTTHFETIHPTFLSEVKKQGLDRVITTAPINNRDGQIWSYLNNGTNIRYAWMTPDFTPKTKPGTLSTSRGSGKFSRLTVDQPTEGIEARGWTEIVASETASQSFATKVQSSINSVMRKFR